mgnify:FL=1
MPTFFRYKRLQEPYLLFNMRRRYSNPRIGLVRAGPYDAFRHRNDEVHVGLIVESNVINDAKKFMEYLKLGYNYYKGFKSTFGVKDFVFNDRYVKTVDPTSSNDVLRDIEYSYHELADNLPSGSTIIVVMDDDIIESNYIKIKAFKFYYHDKEVRLQLVRRSTLEMVLKDPDMLDFTLLNVATAIYARAGGTPWVLEHELLPAGIFIGIAFTKPKSVGPNEFFYYGILTVYDKFGKYLDMRARALRVRIPGVRKPRTKGLYIPRSDMEKLLEGIISDYKPPVVILHKSARFHEGEIAAVRNVLGGMGIRYALIHIESSNPYRGYGKTCNGTVVRGDLILDMELRDRAILFTTGCVQGAQNRAKPGTPKPLELEVEGNTTPYSAEDFAGQVLALTKLDWNTTDPEVRMPVTIKYARRAAALMQVLSSQSGIVSMDLRDLI